MRGGLLGRRRVAVGSTLGLRPVPVATRTAATAAAARTAPAPALLPGTTGTSPACRGSIDQTCTEAPRGESIVLGSVLAALMRAAGWRRGGNCLGRAQE